MELLELKEAVKDFPLALTDEMLQQFDLYADLLKEWNQKMNLTAIVEKEEVVEKHFYDCLLPLQHVSLSGKVADVGSGAGFPGLVFAITNPNVELHLIEPTGKRCTFLEEVVKQLNLKNVFIHNERSEDYVQNHREEYDFVTARAVANLPVLSELCVPLIKVQGQFLALKGNKGMEELEDAKRALKILGCEEVEVFEDHLLNGDDRCNLLITKNKSTPKKYPRSYARIKKKPL